MDQEKILFLLGAGGHCKRCLDIFSGEGIKIGGIFDDSKKGIFYHNYEILDTVDNVRNYLKEGSVLFCTIGDNKTRELVAEKFKDCLFINCISPLAYISPTVEIGLGNFVGDFSIISSEAKIGSFNIINDGAIFNHDCSMVDYNHISLGVACGGGISLGNGNLIGIKAAINPRVRIGNWNIIGSGAVIIRDIENDRKVVGVPGRYI